MERYIAIDNVCAWPNLTRLPTGEISATIFNKPFHGLFAGDLECWVSADEGRTWKFRSVVAPHKPNTNRMNVAVGLTHQGDLLAIASGWGPMKEVPEPQGRSFKWGTHHKKASVLTPWVCRSRDGGKTWQRGSTVSCGPKGAPAGKCTPVPYGDIKQVGKNHLICPMYLGARFSESNRMTPGSYCFHSFDDGKSWGNPQIISPDHNETYLHCINQKHWLALARGKGTDLFSTKDQGRTWKLQTSLTGILEHPGHILKLRNGILVATFSIRHKGYFGVGTRVSDDRGANWRTTAHLVNFGDQCWDGGYPSSVQTKDGSILTAYYARRTLEHHRYHMGVIRWTVEEAYGRNGREKYEY